MAEITVERKPKRPIWPFLLALVVLAAAAWAVWEFYIEPRREVAEAPPVEGASELPFEVDGGERTAPGGEPAGPAGPEGGGAADTAPPARVGSSAPV